MYSVTRSVRQRGKRKIKCLSVVKRSIRPRWAIIYRTKVRCANDMKSSLLRWNEPFEPKMPLSWISAKTGVLIVSCRAVQKPALLEDCRTADVVEIEMILLFICPCPAWGGTCQPLKTLMQYFSARELNRKGVDVRWSNIAGDICI